MTTNPHTPQGAPIELPAKPDPALFQVKPETTPDFISLYREHYHEAPAHWGKRTLFTDDQLDAYARAAVIADREAGLRARAAQGEPVATIEETCVGANIRIFGVPVPSFHIGIDDNARRHEFVDAVNLAASTAPAAGSEPEATVPYSALFEIAQFFNIDYNDLIEVVDNFEKAGNQNA